MDVFFDTMSDFNVPGSRPKKSTMKFRKLTVGPVITIAITIITIIVISTMITTITISFTVITTSEGARQTYSC